MKYLYLSALIFLSTTIFSQNLVGTNPENKKVLLEAFTGSNCYYCAEAQAIAKNIQANNPDQIIWLNMHAGLLAVPNNNEPDFRNTISSELASFSELSSYPAGMVNRQRYSNWAQNNNSYAMSPNNWAAASDSILSESSPVNIAAKAILDVSNNELKVIVETYYTANASNPENRLFVALLQDSIQATQEGAALFDPMSYDSSSNLYMHRNVLMDYISSQEGLLINNTTSSTFRADTFSYSLPTDFNGISVDVSKIKVASWVSSDSANVLNATYAIKSLNSPNPIATEIISSKWAEDFDLICGTEADFELTIKNLGTDPISSVKIDYDINNGTASGTYTASLSTSLATGYSTSISVPGIGNLNQSSNSVQFTISAINAQPNPNINSTTTTINSAPLTQSDSTNGVVHIFMDNYPLDISWELRDESIDSLLLEGAGFATANDTVIQFFDAVDGHCYSFKIMDAYGDGICCNYGQGFYSVLISDLLILNGSNFGYEDGGKFKWQLGVTGINYQNNSPFNFSLFPNPAQDILQLDINSLQQQELNILIHNPVGQLVRSYTNVELYQGPQQHSIDLKDLPNGVYLLSLQKGSTVQTTKFIIMK